MKRRLAANWPAILCVILCASYTAYVHVTALTIPYLEEGWQIKRHIWVLEGTSTDPWQYRVLSEWLVEGVLILTARLGLPHSIAVAFILFRLAQALLIFWLAVMYYKKLGLSTYAALVGLAILTWAMIHSYYNTDLALNTFTDVICYLLAGLAVLNRRYGWIVPITIIAALNRETSGFIPLIALADVDLRSRDTASKHMIVASVVGLMAYVLVFFGLRQIIGPRKLFIPYGNHPGLELFRYNVSREITWNLLFATLSIFPFLAIAAWRHWPRTLRMFFWIVVPAWFVIHLFTSVMAETRLFLVPHTLVFIPGALLGISYWSARLPTPVQDT